jgi:hypothetical protein
VVIDEPVLAEPIDVKLSIQASKMAREIQNSAKLAESIEATSMINEEKKEPKN